MSPQRLSQRLHDGACNGLRVGLVLRLLFGELRSKGVVM